MTIVIHDVQGAKEPVTLDAPVILDAMDPLQADAILQFIDVLKWSRSTDVAAAEAKRLSDTGYFDALSKYARNAVSLGAPDVNGKLDLTSPQNLSRVFNEASAITATALISEVVIIASNIYDAKKTEGVFHRSRYDAEYQTAFGVFSFGFFQVFDREQKQSATFATFTVDSKTIAPVQAFEPQKMFSNLQAIMSLVNHDMLHHLTSPIIAPVVAHRNNIGTRYGLPVQVWGEKVSRYGRWGGDTEAYEDWAQIAQEHVVMMRDPDGKKTGAHVDDYFKELTRIRDAALAKAEDQAQKDAVREAVNYCALLMGHALTRVYPLNHPVMAACLDKMTAVDPQPLKSIEDALFTSAHAGRNAADRAEALEGAPTEAEKIKRIMVGFGRSVEVLRQCGIMPEEPKGNPDKQQVSSLVSASDAWKKMQTDRERTQPCMLKLMQLTQISIVDVMSHVPESKRMNISRLRKDGAALTLDMIESMDATLKILK